MVGLIYELIDKVNALEAENAHLRELFHSKGKKKDQAPQLPSFVRVNVKSKGVRVRKKRQNSFHRFKETPTERIFHSPKVCFDCGGKLGKPTVAYRRQIIDLPRINYKVVEHVIFKRWCFECHKRVTPRIDLSKYTLGKGRIGLNLATSIALMRDRLRLPLNVIQKYLRLFHNLPLSQGEIVEILHQVADIGKDNYDSLLNEVRISPVIYADETGGRENGRNGYFWSFSTPKVHFLLYRKSRSQKVVEEVVGAESQYFDGVIVSDFYSSYNTYSGFHQRCWVHLLRDIDELIKQHPKHPPLKRWIKQVKAIYEEAKDYHPPPDLKIGIEAEVRVAKQREFESRLIKLCQPYLTKETPMSTLCGRIYTFLPELFTFIRFKDIESSNNNAERILRHLVTSRKISGGTRSERGSETKVILTSLFDTWKSRGLNPFIQCRAMLALCQ